MVTATSRARGSIAARTGRSPHGNWRARTGLLPDDRDQRLRSLASIDQIILSRMQAALAPIVDLVETNLNLHAVYSSTLYD